MKKKKSFKELIVNYPQMATVFIFVLVMIVFSVLSPVNKEGFPVFISQRNIMSILDQTAGISIASFGMTMVLLIGGIDLSMGAMLGMTGVLSSHLMVYYGFSELATVLFCLIIGAFFGFVNGFIITRWRVQPFLVTLGTMNIIRGIGFVISQGQSTYITSTVFRDVFSGFKVFGVSVLVFWTFIFLILAYVLISKTAFGRRTQAIGGNEEAALNSGIKVNRTKIIVYSINGMIGAFVGLLMVARLGSGMPSVGDGFEMNAITSSVLGGTTFSGDGGNMFGTLLGSLVIGTVVNGLTILGVNSYVQSIVKGGIIILTIVGSTVITRKTPITGEYYASKNNSSDYQYEQKLLWKLCA